MNPTILVLLIWSLLAAPVKKESSIFEHALRTAKDALAAEKLDDAAILIRRALERDPRSPEAWKLRAAWAEAAGDRDELIYALHKRYGLMLAQRAPGKEVAALRQRIEELDPVAGELFRLREGFIDRLEPIAEQYEHEKRPHSAIRILLEILALDPEHEQAQAAIERISQLPDPSLADTAKPKDLLADVSEEWIRERDTAHADWKKADSITRDNYVTKTDAGYEVLVRAAEAMEQMNAFYRRFFQYGDGAADRRSVPRITLHIFKSRDEYLTLGIGPPVEWSGGHFTGSHVETYIGEGGFEECVTTLFHEAAHQFVALATTAVGWLNEGLASFFEGCRILSNGTVIMNMPANHRLFPLVERLRNGWMADHTDGLEPGNPNATPTTAPTLQIIIENKYSWGPPWYAPTWGFVFFLFNYQDPADGRFIYRGAFHQFVNASGGRMGEGAVENFEKVVLGNPQKPTRGLPRTEALKLPRTIDALNEVWKEWLIELADEQAGRAEVERPYLDWALFAIKRKEWAVATEHFEKGLVRTPEDIGLLREFADHLAERENNKDRATKLVLTALRIVESEPSPDERVIRELELRLSDWDPKRASLDRIHEELWSKATSIVERYLDDNLPMMAMELSWRLGTDLGVPGLFSLFEKAARSSRKSIALWQLAYNEENLDGWTTGGDVWVPYGSELWSRFGDYQEGEYRFNFLTFDKVTSGDFSMEMEVLAERGRSSFCGLVFGRKAASTFHAVILHPGRDADSETGRQARPGSLDLSSFYGAAAHKVWRHNPVDTSRRGWHRVRVDVIGAEVDVWFDDVFVVTHDFGTVDVLRGAFGLITGPGTAKYRNVRYLARNPRDPGAAIERSIRMEKLEKDSQSGSLGGSWLRKVPPFPSVKSWVQGGRINFDQAGPVPILLVFWSRQQNELLPIDRWLTDLAQRHEDIGLDIISIAHFGDLDGMEEYLAEHPFPGSVGVDSKVSPAPGTGDSFELYAIPKFNLPRLLLLDVDHRVYWEGDPGLEFSVGWQPGLETYLDEPLRELAKRRHLRDLLRWRETWAKSGGPALGSGDLRTALPLLQKSLELPGRLVPMVEEAQRWLRALDNAVRHLEVTADMVAERGAEPALQVLAEWAVLLEQPPDAGATRAAKKAAGSAPTRDWKKALKAVARTVKTLKPGREWEVLQALVGELEPLEGVFPAGLRIDLIWAIDRRDLGAARELLENAERRPAIWLVLLMAAA